MSQRSAGCPDSVRDRMLQAARRARTLLAESAERVAGFLAGRQNPDGGFRGRGEESDLYYSLFALDGLAALGHAIDEAPVATYVAYELTRGDGEVRHDYRA